MQFFPHVGDWDGVWQEWRLHKATVLMDQDHNAWLRSLFSCGFGDFVFEMPIEVDGPVDSGYFIDLQEYIREAYELMGPIEWRGPTYLRKCIKSAQGWVEELHRRWRERH